MATDLNKKTVYITDRMQEEIESLRDKLGMSAAELMRTALALGLEDLDGKGNREAREEAEREEREREYKRFCEALDERLDTELTVSYATLASCAIFFPKVFMMLEKNDITGNDEEEKKNKCTKFLDGFRHLSSAQFCELLLHIGAGMAGGQGMLSEGMADANDWGWDGAKQGATEEGWQRGVQKETRDILMLRDGSGFPSKGKPSPRIARKGAHPSSSAKKDGAAGDGGKSRSSGTGIPKRSDRPGKRDLHKRDRRR